MLSGVSDDVYGPEGREFESLRAYAAVGVFCFRGGLNHFAFLSHDLSSDMEDTVLDDGVVTLQAQQFTAAQACGQVDVAELEYTSCVRMKEI